MFDNLCKAALILEKKNYNQPQKIRLEPLCVLHGHEVALSKDEITGLIDVVNDCQPRFDKAIEMASDPGLLFGAVVTTTTYA